MNGVAIRTKKDLRVVQGASSVITELGVELDRRLDSERRPAERLRMLRETTVRITRVANDAVHAYARARHAITAEVARSGGNAAAAAEVRTRLEAARLEVLCALEVAQRRYPWVDADTGPAGARGASQPPVSNARAPASTARASCVESPPLTPTAPTSTPLRSSGSPPANTTIRPPARES